jgi:hypothetical protein
MDEATYETWWKLHLRAARGEALSAEETVAYERGLQVLDRKEILDGDLAELRRAREAVKGADARRAELQTRHATLAAEIATLEGSLSKRTKQLLGVAD